MFNFFRREKGTGAVSDPRSEREQSRDYTFSEVARSADKVNWVEKDEKDWRKFPIFDQNGSGSCVAQTITKMLGIHYWLENNEYVHFSATDVYQQRYNKPDGGMAAFDVFNIVSKNGASLEELIPSQNMTDSQMDSVKVPEYKREVGRVFKVDNYVKLQHGDIDEIASVIQKTGKGVMVWFFFKRSEWKTEPKILYPDLTKYGNVARHSVTAVDFFIYKGKKCLLIEDSWGYEHGKGGRRIISEDFFKARNYYAAYLMNFNFQEFEPEPNKPQHTFTRTMEYSPTYNEDPDVKALQVILTYEGLFPTNIDQTGYYGGITSSAVLKFQKKYRVASDNELDSLQGRICGPKTIAKLNELYGR